jgi:hypothetical protein
MAGNTTRPPAQASVALPSMLPHISSVSPSVRAGKEAPAASVSFSTTK